jgi:hypothetical protein
VQKCRVQSAERRESCWKEARLKLGCWLRCTCTEVDAVYRYNPDFIPRVSAGLDQSGIACTWPCALRCGSARAPVDYCPIRGRSRGKNG